VEAVKSVAPPGRVRGIDATRGAAMFFVCLAHFGYAYFGLNGADRTGWIVAMIGKVASPTFMLISGIVLGVLYALHREDFSSLRDRLIDRGIFLLTIAHVTIAGAHFAVPGGIPIALVSGVITDSIGFNLVVGALVITRISSMRRLVVGAIVYSVAWILVFLWQPQATWVEMTKQVLVGSTRVLDSAWEFDCPLAPWFGYYFAASALGEKLGVLYMAGDSARIKRLVLRLGGGAMASTLWLVSVFIALHRFRAAAHRSTIVNILSILSAPMQKNPPSPAYFALYGGVGLLMLLFFLKLDGIQAAGIELAVTVGQTSLFAFVIEYYIYLAIIYPMHLSYTVVWPLYFVASVVTVAFTCWIWRQRGYNRFITVGYVPSAAE
jgi:hypothetical protein